MGTERTYDSRSGTVFFYECLRHWRIRRVLVLELPAVGGQLISQGNDRRDKKHSQKKDIQLKGDVLVKKIIAYLTNLPIVRFAQLLKLPNPLLTKNSRIYFLINGKKVIWQVTPSSTTIKGHYLPVHQWQ